MLLPGFPQDAALLPEGGMLPGQLLLLAEKDGAKNSWEGLAALDSNKDGKLEFGEYVKLVQALAPREAAPGKVQ